MGFPMVPLKTQQWSDSDTFTLIEQVQHLNDPEMDAFIQKQSEEAAHKEMEEVFGPIGECLYCKNKTFLSYYGIACEECTTYLPG